MPEPRPKAPPTPLRALLLVAPALVLACAPLAAQTFDRFFTTAADRLLLDEARQEFHDPTPLPKPVAQAPVADKDAGPLVPQITLSGVVIRGRGQDTSWINGSGIRPDEVTPEGIRVQPNRGTQAGVQIVLPGMPLPIRLRPGERIDLATGAVLDIYQRDVPGEGSSVFDGLGGTPAGAGTGDAGTDSEPESPAASGG